MNIVARCKPYWLLLSIILTLTLFFGHGGVSTAAASSDTITVCASGCDHTSIQAAINAASSGDTIELAAETYTEAGITVNKRLTISGVSAVATIVQAHEEEGQADDRVFFISADVTLENMTIRHGNADEEGGGIYNSSILTVNNSVISDNQAGSTSTGFGGGIYNDGTLTVNRSIFESNSAKKDRARGGGIYNASDETATVSNSTFVNNDAGSGFLPSSRGGGIYNRGDLTVRNSTIINNSASNSLTSEFDGGGGIHSSFSAIIDIRNTIIADNTGGDCFNLSSYRTFTNNLVKDSDENACGMGNGFNGNITGEDPKLLSLDDYGGPTQTYALDGDSPAINAGSSSHCTGYDQRGIGRPQGAGCDIGAFEVVDCATNPFSVSSTFALNTAIDCYNNQTAVGTYTINFSSDIILNAATTPIDNNTGVKLIINGNGHALDGQDTYRGLEIESDTDVTIESLTIHNGFSSNAGGGIHNEGTLTVNDNILRDNTASDGAGITNVGILFVNISTFSDNETTVEGGALFNNVGATVTITGSIFSDNTSGDDGGGVRNNGQMTVNTTTFSGNSAANNGGGIDNQSELTVTGSTFKDNTAIAVGGGINSRDPLTLTQSTIISNTAGLRGGGIFNNDTLTIDNSIISNNKTTADVGGGVFNAGSLTVNNGTFSNNESSLEGGALFNSVDAIAMITDSTFSDNTSGDDGGGVRNNGQMSIRTTTFSGNEAANNGGGIDNQSELTVTNSTLNNNQAGTDGGSLHNLGTAMVVNSTFDNNKASTDGGGIDNAGTLTLNNSTFSGNSASNFGGGVMNIGGTLHLHNTIIAGSTGRDCRSDTTLASAVNNLIQESGANACNLIHGTDGNLIGVDPLLDALADNGGPTLTHALTDDSPAIDAGDNTICADVTTVNNLDQRGFSRPIDGDGDLAVVCDIGAFEACPSFPTNVASTVALNGTIRCYNAITDAGSYAIHIMDDISLSTATMEIDNTTAGVELVIEGNDYFLDGNDTYRGLTIAADTDVTINNLIIQNGYSDSDGGGIYNAGTLTVNNSTLSDNSADSKGGGIYNKTTVNIVLTISESVLTGNSATDFGGGIANFGSGDASITRSTVDHNSAGVGGGVYHSGREMTVINSTFSGNSADVGGGIVNASNDMIITNSTIYGNSATIAAGGIGNGGHLSLRNTIITNSIGEDCYHDSGFTSSSGNNLIEDSGAAACDFIDGENGNLIGYSAELDSLQDNGGLTPTHALLPSSPAIDAGDSNICANADTVNNLDQRGITRPQGAECDIGAYEYFDCSVTTFDVSNIYTFNEAIDCYNEANTGAYNLNLTADIRLDVPTTAIDNPTANVELVITGNGYVLDGNNIYRGLTIATASNVTVNNLTIQNGYAGASGADGGGIANAGTLTVNRSTLNNNTAADKGGGIYNDGTLTVSNSTLNDNVAADKGGGIYNDGTLTANNSTFSNNTATNDSGGGIFNRDTLALNNSTFSSNTAGGGFGGGIINIGAALTLNNTIIADSIGRDCRKDDASTVSATNSLITDSGNDACSLVDATDGNIIGHVAQLGILQDNGGSTFTHALLPDSTAIDAGDNIICADTSTVNNRDQRGIYRLQGGRCDIGAFELFDCATNPFDVSTTFALNTAIGCFNNQTATGIYTISVRSDITLNAATTEIDNTNDGVNLVLNGNGYTLDGDGTYRGLTIAADTDVTIENLTLQNGYASGSDLESDGGGIFNLGILTLNNSTVRDNSAERDVGGIYNRGGTLLVSNSTVSGNSATFGGGIYNNEGGTVTVTSSTINGNRSNRDGGGLYSFNGTVTVINSTISDNESEEEGGGIFIYDGTTTVTNSTLSGNSADNGDGSATNDGGGIYNNSNGSLTLNNSIVANSSAGGDCVNLGTFNGQNNLIEDGSCDTNAFTGDPLLGSLQNNGGSTHTHALLANSPAIDAGNNTLCADTATVNNLDQRGSTRPVDGNGDSAAVCDIGAYEAEAACPAFPIEVASTTQLNTAIGCYNALTATGDYIITFTADITLTAETTVIDNGIDGIELTISGEGHILDGDNTYSGLTIAADTDVTINELTIQNHTGASGSSRGAARASDFVRDGGGLYNQGNLTVNDSTLNGNSAEFGGGIYNTGTLTLHESTLSGNSATQDGGGIYNRSGTLTSDNSTLSNNAATQDGGGLYNHSDGTLTLNNTIIANSSTGGDCHGHVSSGVNNLIESTNEAACNLTDGTNNNIIGQDPQLGSLQDNGAATHTHALDADSPAIDAGDNGFCDTQGSGDSRQAPPPGGPPPGHPGRPRPPADGNGDGVADCDIGAHELEFSCHSFPASVAVTGQLNVMIGCFNDVTTAGTYSINLVKDVTLDASITTIENTNEDVNLIIAGHGHALDGDYSLRVLSVAADTNVTLEQMLIRNGRADNGGGILNHGTLTLNQSTFNGNMATDKGGVIYNDGTLTLNNSTLSDNEASDDGGGIYNSNLLTVNNSTFSGNTAIDSGGGIINFQGALTVNNSTFSGNTAIGFGGGIINLAGNLHLNNTLIAASTGGDCRSGNPVSSASHNLIQDSDSNACGLAHGIDGNLIGVDPLLDPLANNGGATHTHAPDATSLAIDAGDPATCLTTDQRGEARNDFNCDIGAVELKLADNNIVTQDDIPDGETVTFGPVHVRMERNGGNAPGPITINKQIVDTQNDETFDIIWAIEAETNSGLNLNVTFCYLESDIPPAIADQEANFVIYRQPSSGGAFSQLATTVDEANNCVTATVTGFSNFGIGLAAPTAVVLESFTATIDADNTVTLNWTTASEIDHAGFNLYRRAINSRADWLLVSSSMIASHGLQAQGASYQFIEEGVASGTWAYLLEDVETDGNTYRHLGATASVTITTPTAVKLATHHARTMGSLPLIFAQFIGLLLMTLGVFSQRNVDNISGLKPDKPIYVPPTIASYSTAALHQQLGPARAFSHGRSLDDELLLGGG